MNYNMCCAYRKTDIPTGRHFLPKKKDKQMNGLHVKHTDLHTNKNTCSLADKVDYTNSCTAISMICLPTD